MIIICSTMSNAQYCLPGYTTFNTQAQIDAFSTNYPGCSNIQGWLYIIGTDITNLNGLSQLTDVTQGLEISNTNITNLNGLNNLTHVGRLTINGNANLQSLNGIGSLNSFGLSYFWYITF